MDDQYYRSIKEWRSQYERKLGAPDGWLSISGLFWLQEGRNRLGSDSSCEVGLPLGAAPRHVGELILAPGKITLRINEDVTVTLGEGKDAEVVTSLDVKLGDYGSSEWFFIDQMKFAVIQRGVRFGVRVYDPNNPARRKFHHVNWAPIDEDLRIEARYVPAEEPFMLAVMNVLGDLTQEECPGHVEFTLDGKEFKLYPLEISDERFWFLFKDSSNGKLTYPGGRFLVAEGPQDGLVTLDFNKAYNPPCAYTHFATCPLPPELNRLDVAMNVGEMEYIK